MDERLKQFTNTMKRETETISMKEYDYMLPDKAIACYPLEDRSSCKLLYYNHGDISTYFFSSIASLLPSNSLLVRNNTRVIRARIYLQKRTGAQIELLCLEPVIPSQYEQSLTATQSCVWRCMVGNARKWKEGVLEREVSIEGRESFIFSAERIEKDLIRFSWQNASFTFGQILDQVGILPIPPYLNRDTEERDNRDYQTVYAVNKGSVAAPTAGLHFTDKEFEEIAQRGIPVLDVTLHVGAGTFLPVKSDDIKEHLMHQELCIVTRDTIEQLLGRIETVIAIGTTSVRTLESLYYIARNHLEELGASLEGVLPSVSQWEPYETTEEVDTKELLQKLLLTMEEKGLSSLVFSTSLLIIPGYRFRIIKGLITNFHQPKSTLLLMIAALLGHKWKDMYEYALANGYRFLSYGDASLLLP
ncbi:S-adenosylmethionine:tRNA ribosyltransferase-isomerase [Porphyromonas circumdentaria]|uniref:S-adenosylmethionine:tRNA ribosyltransferase-isomerase n=2 Tax=Porphyromonas circumdentaria TaxID=29524 RepID=A0A1T4LBA3_9PORP|nr:S-adenosylmethionine:tRNA ribosyltransferase-isomerase [Porphyromonas circumdentaria]SJZ51818.1 S-adenosylmethionine:tRNA ribosyltransferase-isomerase [Porphyromonas circumdentaria]